MVNVVFIFWLYQKLVLTVREVIELLASIGLKRNVVLKLKAMLGEFGIFG